ncbi:hypothetical protein ACO22_06776 [Paracoccidioides brasiliensis]|uniref:Guanine nucleotide exchange factor LTE1 n=1 Tax=Paracoccidioides brasiliensis TaxID=121759 RepID=A0A1D2J6I4_PARBR|nr:hypothetical protein ACO22_06776 [Paracoccidioides brasiliensis]
MESQFTERTALTPVKSDGKTPWIFTGRAANQLHSKQPSNHTLQPRNHSMSIDAKKLNRSHSSKGKKSSNSLRRVKNSSDVLRQRALKRSNTIDVTPESIGKAMLGGREARNFTVGNVGHNGKMYLRPTNRNKMQHLPFVKTATARSTKQYLRSEAHQDDESRLARHSMWSNSQLSELRPHLVRENSNKSTYDTSTISDDQGSTRHSLDEIPTSDSKHARKELRVVIERHESDRPKSGEPPFPAIEVPIPHFRLGGFRFTAEGNPTLRSSAYTRTSVGGNIRSSTLTANDFDMTRNLSHLNQTSEPSQPFPDVSSKFTRSRVLFEIPTSLPAQASVFYKLREPIEPSIFDFLVGVMDDPSVVRYVKGSNEICAATPARIVAQISSDSFMDYELVSDFFLTFRTYLSPSNLLSLLLARLEWAINKPEDDGRIIRIRTFAALRHWILNYFVDDFVINRDLRVQFCQKLNQIYENVKNCSNNSASDLKILLDIKRCWNGRCALYWDSPNFLGDTHPDEKVLPGGVAGSRDARLSCLSGIPSSLRDVESQSEEVALHIALPPLGTIQPRAKDIRSSQSHVRNISTASGQDLPPSADSVKSIQAVSCSLPSKVPKRESVRSTRPKGPYLVLVTTSPRTSPASPGPLPSAPMIPVWRRPAHSHKRSGSFSDSVRDDRAPLPALNLDTQRKSLVQALPQTESIIRGNAYAPIDPSVPTIAPPSPTMEAAHFDFLQTETTGKGGNSSKNPPAMKTFIGNIRRALQNRHSNNSSSSGPQATSPNPVAPLRGKTSALPLNVGVGSDAYREKRPGPDVRVTPRIDILCDDALQSYRYLSMQESRKLVPVVPEVSDIESEKVTPQPVVDRLNPENIYKFGVWPERIHSQLSAGSKSIVIVDDTRPPIPMMSGALQAIANSNGSRQSQETPLQPPEEVVDTLVSVPGPSLQHYASDHSISTTRDFRCSEEYVRPSILRSGSKTPVRASSTKLRKYASYHSGMIRRGTNSSIGSTRESASHSASPREAPGKPLARMLRRRPGGDLRKIQNVHDLEVGTIKSFVSTTSYTESMGESVLYMNGDYGEEVSSIERRDHPDEVLLPTTNYSFVGKRRSRQIRASFEAAVAGFSKIPDDEDGGIESTLLKLEGKWEKPSAIRQDHQHIGANYVDNCIDNHNQDPKGDFYQEQHTAEPDAALASQLDSRDRRSSAMTGQYAESFMGSEDSYCSIPLLERGLNDDSMKSPNFKELIPVSQLLSGPYENQAVEKPQSSHPSIDMVEETESMKRIPRGSTIPRPHTLEANGNDCVDCDEDNDNGYCSELSSEISVIDKDEVVDKQYGLGVTSARNMEIPSLGVLSHPLTHPPSPPMTVQHLGLTSSYAAPLDPLSFQRQPITPDLSPNCKNLPSMMAPRTLDMQHLSNNVLFNSQTQTPSQARIPIQGTSTMASPNSHHLPFVLACESMVLAQQFTLIEKAALNEVDWKDLVDMKWSHSSQSTLNWADYLSQSDRRGIDLVVARFNLMVKWAVSEVLLTSNIAERAQTITKLIHVAVHARRLRNYSTMLQITIALSSVDCTRLKKTWELVSDGEKGLLRDMELLIQPIRNFHKLRLEMETTNLQDGCVPFIGLYVQDLTYNSQKPAQIASTRDGEPLVNFERYRTAATIVKSLLRLIDASTKYTFEPAHGIIERCLWISALPDEKIVALSKSLEHSQ